MPPWTWWAGSSARRSRGSARRRSRAAGWPTSRCGRSAPDRRATPAQAGEVHGHLRGLVGELAGPQAAEACPILYGGSAKPENVAALLAEPHLDGGLVGGASLKAADFVAIVRLALEVKGRAATAAR